MFRNNEPISDHSRRDVTMSRQGGAELPALVDKWKDWEAGAGH